MKRFAGVGFCTLLVCTMGCTKIKTYLGLETQRHTISPERMETYEQVAYTACINFALDVLGQKPRQKSALTVEASIFSAEVDNLLEQHADVSQQRLTAAQNYSERDEAAQAYLEGAVNLLRAKAPQYLDLCDRLTQAFVKCDQFAENQEQMKTCLLQEQRPALMKINEYLTRNFANEAGEAPTETQ